MLPWLKKVFILVRFIDMQLRARRVNNYDLYANHAWYTPYWKGLFALLGWFFVGALIGSIIEAILMAILPKDLVMDYSMVIVYPLQFIPAMVWVASKSQRNSLFETGYKLSSKHFGKFTTWQIALITVALTLASMVSADLPNYWNYRLTTATPAMKELYDYFIELMQQMIGGPFWSSFLVIAVFAAIFEEWLYRGMILRGFLTKMKPGAAIIVSALFFAVIHLNPWQALNAFIIGVIMGFVYYKTGCLWLTMLIHFINNGISVIIGQFSSLAEYDFLKDIIPAPYYAIIYVVSLIVLAGALLAFKSIPLEQSRGNIDTVSLVEE